MINDDIFNLAQRWLFFHRWPDHQSSIILNFHQQEPAFFVRNDIIDEWTKIGSSLILQANRTTPMTRCQSWRCATLVVLHRPRLGCPKVVTVDRRVTLSWHSIQPCRVGGILKCFVFLLVEFFYMNFSSPQFSFYYFCLVYSYTHDVKLARLCCCCSCDFIFTYSPPK